MATVAGGGTTNFGDSKLFGELLAFRKTLAAERSIEPHHVFDNNVLRELARVKPKSLEEFIAIDGVNTAKASTWGPMFLEKVRASLWW